MKTEDIKVFTPKEHKLYPKRYKSAYKQYDKYFLFIERAFKLLKEDGAMGYIVPSKFMKVGAGKELRKYISSNKSIKAITSFGAHQVFPTNPPIHASLFCKTRKMTHSRIQKLIVWQNGKFAI